MDLQYKIEFLEKVDSLQLLDESLRTQLAGCLEPVSIPFGETVFSRGDPSDAMYIIFMGKARVIGTDPSGQEISLNTYSVGEHFGELGIISHTPRTATIRAAEDLMLLRLSGADFDRILQGRKDVISALQSATGNVGIRNFLKQFTAMSHVPAHVLRTLVDELQEIHVKKGEDVVKEGEEGDTFFIVRKGWLEATQKSDTKHPVTGVLIEKPVGQIAEGELFGELRLLTGVPRTASVTARSDCELYSLTKQGFDRAIEASPEFKKRIESQAEIYRTASSREEESKKYPKRPSIPFEETSPDAPPPPDVKASLWRRWLKRYPHIRQHDETDCAAACLAMITKYYGHPVGIARLRDMANVDADGATLWSVAQASESLGFEARGLHLSFDALSDLTLPSIIHWEGFHYMVLYEVGKKHVVVGDPGTSLKRMTIDEFRKGWTGRALELFPTNRMEDTKPIKGKYKRFWPIVKPYTPFLGEAMGASIILTILGLGTPLFTQMIIDRVLVNKSVDFLTMLLIGMILIAVFKSLIDAVRSFLLVHISIRLDSRLIGMFMRHVWRLPMKFFDIRRTGDIVSRVSENDKIQETMSGAIPGLILDIVLATGYLVMLANYNLTFTGVVLLIVPVLVILMLGFTPMIRRNREELFAKHATSNSYLIETVNGRSTVKAMAVESQVRAQFESHYAKMLRVARKGSWISIIYSNLAGFTQMVGSTFLLWYGAKLVMEGKMTIGQLMAFTTMAASLISPILNLVRTWDQLQDARNAVERLNDVFDAEPEEEEEKNRLYLSSLQGKIRFENITFKYSESQDKPVLAKVNLTISPGETIALVGRSGSGKTTLAKLLQGLYVPTKGRIFIDDHDIRNISLYSFRKQIGIVPQEVILFSGTIRENISMGSPEANLEEVTQAAKLAGAHGFISEMGLGYDTKVGEQGMSVSGGQRQRIALARALLNQPRILILDEATSALDTESEKAIQKNLEEATAERTTVIIAHRLSTVRNADRILVVDGGSIVEEGTHEELVKLGGLYQTLTGEQLDQ